MMDKQISPAKAEATRTLFVPTKGRTLIIDEDHLGTEEFERQVAILATASQSEIDAAADVIFAEEAEG